jgi:hypothetical protein
VGYVRKFSALALVAMLGVSAAAEQRRNEVTRSAPGASTAVKFDGAWRPAGETGYTRVVGTVIDIRQVPVANTQVRLRDLKTGLVLSTDDTNEAGEYEFSLDDSGTYVVEMVMPDNTILAVSNAGSLRRYSTMTTVIQLPGRWDFNARAMILPVGPTSFLGVGSAMTMTSQTLTLAIDANIGPTDTLEPVSAQ